MNGLPENVVVVQSRLHKHVDDYRRLPEDSRLRDLGAEKALIQDYSGRVVYELLQNALDRAEKSILVSWNSASCVLEVANDGRAVTTEPVGEKRSDLKALLSVYTSGKSAAESIGNKGVGFRSVFSACREVEVCSRALDGSWWGMRLRHPADVQPAVEDWTEQVAASFYTPQPISVDATARDGFVTVVRLCDVHKPEMIANITNSVKELQQGPLTFLARRAASGLAITLRSNESEVTHILGNNDALAVAERSLDVPPAVRESTGLDLHRAEVRVLAQRTPLHARYWSYLPTEQDAGFGLQVHADFYLSNSRRNLALKVLKNGDSATDPSGWNSSLVHLAADCVLELWQTPAVCESEHFWQYATPRACTCPYLKDAVARRLWAHDAAVFETMIRLSFPSGRLWSAGRYRRLFEALDAWADYAFRTLQHGPLYARRAELLARVEASGAPVLPIITGDPSLEADLPLDARPLVMGVQGQRRGPDTDRIYYRQFEQESAVELPSVVRRQRTYVTTFSTGLDVSLAMQGLLKFERPEILAQIQPGSSPEEHEPLVIAAMDLARQESKGPYGSVLQRAGYFGVGAAWRLVAADTLADAAKSLANLFVRTVDGEWCHAIQCGRARGPWPRIDESWLARVLDVPGSPGNVDHACLLLGIGPIPLDDTGSAALPSELPEETMLDLIAQWPRLSGFLANEEKGCRLQSALEACRWLRAASGNHILDGVGTKAPYRPKDVWWQQVNSGFTTSLLPRLIVEQKNPPQWAQQLRVSNPSDPATRERLHLAFDRLRMIEPRTLEDGAQGERDLIELYRALTAGMFAFNDPTPFPLLYRIVDKAGNPKGLGWGSRDDDIWHDTGDDTAALRSFKDVRVWVVRKASQGKAAAIGLKNFKPESPRVTPHGSSNDDLAKQLHETLTLAIPDLIAGACASGNKFDAPSAVNAFASLVVRHFDDVRIEWTFDGRVGAAGENEEGNVFEHRREDGVGELWFDGKTVPLVECAYPLSELLAGNRAFGGVFKEGLHAWNSLATGNVARFRREHGVSESEVKHWKDRLDELTLTVGEMEAWRLQVQEILGRFGSLRHEVTPGMVVQPHWFDQPLHVHQDEVAGALGEVRRLRPRVAFEGPNAVRLDEVDRVPVLAEAAERHRGAWTERLLVDLQDLIKKPLDGEPERLKWLDFDPVATLRARLNLPPRASATPGADAVAFARGQIPLTSLPKASSNLALKAFPTSASDLGGHEAQSSEQFLKDARRRAAGGRRAEEAVLDLAVPEALGWKAEDPAGFSRELDEILSLLKFDQKARPLVEAAINATGMRALLHVSDYIGDAGFDVLVPRDGRLLPIEVKRVERLKGAAFYLSENERRRAAEYRANGLDWRLWLVTGGGETLDATGVLEPFARNRDHVSALLEGGLHPGEWLFVLDA